jgi:hypothetical protein
MMRRIRRAVRDLFHRATEAVAVVTEAGQTTAEYALVILGAAAIGTLVLTWATKSHVIGKLFDTVVGKILPG